MNTLVNNSIKISGICDVLSAPLLTFKKFNINTNLILPCKKPDMDQIVSTMLNIDIENSHIINTPIATSLEKQNLTGKVLIVSGIVKQKIEYLDSIISQSIHGIQFNIPFSTYVVLSINNFSSRDIVAKGYIEDIYIKQLDSRSTFENITLLINVEFI